MCDTVPIRICPRQYNVSIISFINAVWVLRIFIVLYNIIGKRVFNIVKTKGNTRFTRVNLEDRNLSNLITKNKDTVRNFNNICFNPRIQLMINGTLRPSLTLL